MSSAPIDCGQQENKTGAGRAISAGGRPFALISGYSILMTMWTRCVEFWGAWIGSGGAGRGPARALAGAATRPCRTDQSAQCAATG